MTNRPSNGAIAQAFWEWIEKNGWYLGDKLIAMSEVEKRAREIDAAAPEPPKVAPVDDGLRERCAELLEWLKTGVLPGQRLRSLAATLVKFEEDDRLQHAERQTEMEALQAVAAGAVQPAPTPDVIRDAVSCALRELEVQFVEMSQAASRDGEPTRCDVWSNAASQTRARAKDKEWIDAAIREQQRSEPVVSKSQAKRIAAQKGEGK